MDVSDLAPAEREYQPTSSQLERAAAIRRFNFRFVYLPIGIISLFTLVAIIGLLYLALFPPTEETSETISGMADAFTILGTIPLLLLCAIFPTLAIGVFVQGKRRGSAPLRQLQILFWRLDGGIASGKVAIGKLTQKIANPLITVHAVSAYIKALLHRVGRLFK